MLNSQSEQALAPAGMEAILQDESAE